MNPTEPPQGGLLGDGNPSPKTLSDMTPDELCILIKHFERLIVLLQKQIEGDGQ
jgi:hypothetical protein